MPDFVDANDVRRWLDGRSTETATVIAARAFLRAIPTMAFGDKDHMLPVFRAAGACWVAVRFPKALGSAEHGDVIRTELMHASRQASQAATDIGHPKIDAHKIHAHVITAEVLTAGVRATSVPLIISTDAGALKSGSMARVRHNRSEPQIRRWVRAA
jgi:hypothetical protein